MGSYKEITVKAKNFAILSMKGCYRSVKGHPFLLGFVLFLIFMYRSFPFLFSVLLSASPVLVCTAILLGTLLSFGEPNIPEIEKEETLSRDIVSLRSGVSENNNETFVVERDASFVVERYVGDRRALEAKSVEEEEDTRSVDYRLDGRFKDRVGSPDCVPLINETLREEVEKGLAKTLEEEVRIEEGALSEEKIVENHYSLVRDSVGDENLAVAGEDLPESSMPAGGDGDSEIDNDGDDEDDDDDDDESSYSDDSDRAESSSPDASMADIMPMLDELHPLLDLDAPQPPHMSHDESDAGSDHSHRSEEDHNDNEDDEEEEEPHGGREDESKSAIVWTEDDQKNLMDLGISELERNQRLENLILRRRARKSFRLMAEKNLIDLDGFDLPFNVPQISTARRNPFDLPDDSYEHMGLPPIPGSAPSVLLPRRNPFDLPYDSNEEKPDLKGDNFEQEFFPVHHREAMFRRHESFSMGPSSLGGSRHESRWKPFFVPERLSSEGTSYSVFQRQSSEVSDSKLSSVPDTDSVCSAADTDEKKLSDQDFSKAEPIPEVRHVPELVERTSQSSDEEEDSVVNRDGGEITLGEVENHRERELYLSESLETVAHFERSIGDIHLEAEPVEDEKDGSRSSLSSLSEADERILEVEKDEHVELNTGAILLETEPIEEEEKESSRSSSSSSSDTEDKISDAKNEDVSTSLVAGDDLTHDGHINKEPVYDSSPHAERLLSLSSIASEMQVLIEDEVHAVSREVAEPRESNASNVAPVDSGSLSSEMGIPVEHDHVNEHEDDMSRAADLSDRISSEDLTATGQPEEQVPIVVEHEPLENWEMVQEEMIHGDEHHVLSDSSSDKMSVEEETRESELIHLGKDEAPTSSIGSVIQVEVHLEREQLQDSQSKAASSSSDDEYVPLEEKSSIELDKGKDSYQKLDSSSSDEESEKEKDSDLKVSSPSSDDESEKEKDSDLKVSSPNFDDESEKEKDSDLKVSSPSSDDESEKEKDTDLKVSSPSFDDELEKEKYSDLKVSSPSSDDELEKEKDSDLKVSSPSFDDESEKEKDSDLKVSSPSSDDESEKEKDSDLKVSSPSSDDELEKEKDSDLKLSSPSSDDESEKVKDSDLKLSSPSSDDESEKVKDSDLKVSSPSSDDESEKEKDSDLKVSSPSFDDESEKEKDFDLKVSSPSSDDESEKEKDSDLKVSDDESEKEKDSDLKVSSSSFDESVISEEKSQFKSEKELDSGLKLASSSSNDESVPSEEKSTFKLEKELSSSDKNVELNEEAKGDSSLGVGSPTRFSDSTVFSLANLEYKPLAGEIDLKNSILDRDEEIEEEADEIKDIDEGFLCELDAVGDFGIKEVGEPSASIVKQTNTELQVEGIDLALKQLHEGAQVEEVNLPSEDKEDKSLEDIQIALKQISDSDAGELDSATKIEVVEAKSGVEQNHESLEDLNTSTSKSSDTKSKDRLKRSGSSTSSSSSSSSSDSE